MAHSNEPMPTAEDGHASGQAVDNPRSSGEGQRSNGGGSWLSALRSRLGLGPQQTLRETLEEAVRSDTSADGTFSSTERDMLLRLLRFGGLKVEDVMVPRADIIAIDEEATIGRLIEIFQEAGVSRVPVYHETLDDPRGMVHVKDLLKYLSAADSPTSEPGALRPADVALAVCEPGALQRNVKGAGLLRPVLNVPPSMPAINLLIRMQATRNHIALVVDEYGGTDGLVTIEDLIEQVVGDIEDEYDVDEAANITEDARNGLVAQARTPIAELEAHLGIKLVKPDDEGEIDTVGGLVVAQLGRVPARGELVAHESGIELEVLEADPRRIKRVRVHRKATVGGAVARPDAGAGAEDMPNAAMTGVRADRPDA